MGLVPHSHENTKLQDEQLNKMMITPRNLRLTSKTNFTLAPDG